MSESVQSGPGRRGVLSGGLWKAASTVVPLGSALALTIVISRHLGPEALGLQSLVAYIQALALNTTVLSLTQAGIQVMSRARGAGDANDTAWLARWSLGAHAVAGVAITVTMLVIGAVRDDGPWLWVVIAATGLVDALTYGSTARLVAVHGWAPVSRRRIVSQVVGPLLGIGAVLAGAGVTGAFVGQGAGSLYLLVVLVLLERRQPRPRRTGPAPARLPLLRLTSGFVLTLLLAQVVERRVEVLFLEAFGTTRQVAMFSAAYTVVSVAVTASAALTSAAMPAIAAASAHRTPAQLTELLGHPLRLLAVVSLVLVAGFLSLGPSLVLLLFGDQFTPAAALVRLMSLALLMTPVAGVLSSFWLGTGALRPVLSASLAGAVVDLGLCVLLIPGMGLRGAVTATLGAQLGSATILVTWSRSRFAPAMHRPVWLLRAAVSSALAGGTAWAVAGPLPPWAAVVAGGLVFAVVLAGAGRLLGLLPRRDADWLSGVLPGRVGRVVGALSR